MLTEEQIHSFHKNGYLLVPEVLTPEQVRTLRDFFRPKFLLPPERRLPSDTDQILSDIHSRYPEVQWLLFHEPAVAILKHLLGDDFAVIRESGVHFNRFAGWHTDTTTAERNGWRFMHDEDFLMVQTAYYLQDNTPEYGGGLEVEPGSHKKRDPFVGPKKTSNWRWPFTKWASEEIAPRISIPSKAGDMVIFHVRLIHRASQPLAATIPNSPEKIAVFCPYGRNNRHIKTYMDFIRTRPDPEQVYTYLADAYPDSLLTRARAAGINLT